MKIEKNKVGGYKVSLSKPIDRATEKSHNRNVNRLYYGMPNNSITVDVIHFSTTPEGTKRILEGLTCWANGKKCRRVAWKLICARYHSKPSTKKLVVRLTPHEGGVQISWSAT